MMRSANDTTTSENEMSANMSDNVGAGASVIGASASSGTSDIAETMQFVVSKIFTIKEQFFSVLDDFKKNYILYKKNPDYSEYENAYNENKSQLQGLQKTMFSINNSIQSSTEKISDVKSSLELKLEGLKEQIDNLEIITASLGQNGDSSEVMKDDFVILYNYQYLQNFCLFIGCVIVVILFGALFKVAPPALSAKPTQSTYSSTSSGSPTDFYSSK
jgi:hypothetical protein